MNNWDYYYFGDAPQHLSWVTLDKSSITLTTPWQTEYLSATIIPEDPVEDVTLNWSSSDTSIATVSPYTPRLPSEYQEVEYIESSGTQYIDTLWTPSSNYARVVAQIEPTLSGQQWEVFYGMTNWSNHYSLHTNKDTPKWYINVWSNGNITTNIAFSSWTKVNTEFEANNWAYSVNVNGATYSWTYSWTVAQSTRNMYIFAYNENGSITWKPSMKLYSFKIYSAADTLVRDLVPCYRKADDVIWLYDLVNDTFYTNAWTWDFTKWDDINPDVIVTCVTKWECTITVTTTPWGYTATCDVTYPKWVLYKETDFHNSSYWGFRTAWWYNSASPSYTGFNTTDGYIYSTGNHSRCKICPDTSDIALFQSAKAVKVVCDGFYIGNNTNTYESHIALLSYWRPFWKKSSGMIYPTIISWNAPTYWVWYSAEAIIWNDSTWRVTLSDGSVFWVDNDSWAWDTLVSTSSGGWFYPSASDNLSPIAELFKDQWTTCNLKDVHIYLMFD